MAACGIRLGNERADSRDRIDSCGRATEECEPAIESLPMGWELRPSGRDAVIVALVLLPVFVAAGVLTLFPVFIPRGWKGWVLAYVVGAVVIVAAARSGRRE